MKLQVSKHLNKFAASKYAALIGKINASIWFHCIKKDEDQKIQKEKQGAEGTHS